MKFLKSFIKKNIKYRSKFYILLLFLKSRQYEHIKTLVNLIYNQCLKKKIIFKVDKNKLFFHADNFETTNYFIYNSVIPEKPILIFLYNYFKKKRGTFFDLGGYVGLHSFITKISNAKNRIYIFEADKYKYNIIKKNILINKFKNINLENKFITGIGNKKNPDDFTSYTNKNTSINEYIKKKGIKKIDIVKMDIEGYEYFALKDSDFKKIKVLLLEFHTKVIRDELKKNPFEIIEMLKKYYNLYYIQDYNTQKENTKIVNFKKSFLNNNHHCMIVCSKLNINIIKKNFKNIYNVNFNKLN